MLRKFSLYAMSVFYILAGINHFIKPGFYLALIPPYFPHPEIINIVSGVLEIALGVLLLIPKTRNATAYAIILMLLAFIPAHVYHIQMDGCVSEELCVPVWVAWVRLLAVHPFLLLWAWRNR